MLRKRNVTPSSLAILPRIPSSCQILSIHLCVIWPLPTFLFPAEQPHLVYSHLQLPKRAMVSPSFTVCLTDTNPMPVTCQLSRDTRDSQFLL